MSRDISSSKLVRINNLFAFLESKMRLGKPTPLHVVISGVGYDEGGKVKKTAMRQLERDLELIEKMCPSLSLIRDMKHNTLMLKPARATDGDMSDIGKSWELPAAS